MKAPTSVRIQCQQCGKVTVLHFKPGATSDPHLFATLLSDPQYARCRPCGGNIIVDVQPAP